MKKVDEMTRSVSIPIIDAASRSNAVARIAFPNRVRDTTNMSMAIRKIAAPTTITWTTVTGLPATLKTGLKSGPRLPFLPPSSNPL